MNEVFHCQHEPNLTDYEQEILPWLALFKVTIAQQSPITAYTKIQQFFGICSTKRNKETHWQFIRVNLFNSKQLCSGQRNTDCHNSKPFAYELKKVDTLYATVISFQNSIFCEHCQREEKQTPSNILSPESVFF